MYNVYTYMYMCMEAGRSAQFSEPIVRERDCLHQTHISTSHQKVLRGTMQ